MGMDTISRSINSATWFVCLQPNPAAETRLFIFPYAGGNPAAFSKWTMDNIELQVAHYPGRGSRFNEPLIKEIETLVQSLSLAIQPFLDKPFAVFGHSMGGLIAFELTRSLRRQRFPQPKMLFVSAHAAPQFRDWNPPLHALPDDEFIAVLQRFKSIPAELLNQPEALKILLPTVRADFEAVETYRFDSNEPPLDIPIIAFGGLNDERVNRERLEGWLLQTTSRFESHRFPGDHFFIHTARDAVISSIAAKL